MNQFQCFVSIVAPLHNDSDIIESFIEEILGTLKQNYKHFEVILVDDDSQDNTIEKITVLLTKFESIRLIRLSRSFGQEVAISAGLETAIGDYAVVVIPDTDPAKLIPKMVEQSRGGIDILYGIRKHRKEDPFLQRIGAYIFYWYINRVLKLNIPNNTTHFRVLSRKAVNAMTMVKDRFRYLQTLSTHVGYSNRSFIYETIRRRKKARTKSLFESINLAINIIIVSRLMFKL